MMEDGGDGDLVEWESRLREEVDDDFFEDPGSFRTLHRVIDVLGAQLLDDQVRSTDFENLHKNNPAYLALRRQQAVVEEAIEHMAVAHCGDLNGSVVAVGRVARQFTDAVAQVRSLRRQVRDIQDSLGSGANPNEPEDKDTAANKSLRELWLKKLECEAVLSLLGKLEVIRAAPTTFDAIVHRQPCRIGAAVLLLSNALATMFSDDVAQVQALHKIMEQLMTRKQRAEEIIWDTLHDVIYLRTGNGAVPIEPKAGETATDAAAANANAANAAAPKSSSGSVASETKRRRHHQHLPPASVQHQHRRGLSNPFVKSSAAMMIDATAKDNMEPQDHDDDDDDHDSVQTAGSGASLFSHDDLSVASGYSQKSQRSTMSAGSTATGSGASGGLHKALMALKKEKKIRMMIPRTMLEAELDLEADERRCLEESALSGASDTSCHNNNLPRYADHVLALRILVECLAKLGRLDDVERYLNEGVERELRKIAQREQAKTYARLERRRGKVKRGEHRQDAFLQDFRRHLTGLLSSFGCVMIRLSHLAQILRHRISSDPKLVTPSYATSSCAVHSVLVSAYTCINREIKDFLRACLNESEANRGMNPSDAGGASSEVSSHERGLFSLGIIDASAKPGDGTFGYDSAAHLAASRASTMELPADQFVLNVLFPKTNTSPQVRHALSFRRSLARWTAENADLKKELALITFEDTSSPTYNATTEETALEFLDSVIQKNLLPVLQDEAVNGTVTALEREDAFEPIIDNGMYVRSPKSRADVEMCIACQALYHSTEPLFSALHRLPRGGEMYLPLVAVLEHAILTFISRVKQRVELICQDKMAFRLLENGKGVKDRTVLSSVIERRTAFALLLQAYDGGDGLESVDRRRGSALGLSRDPNLLPLPPPGGDTMPRHASSPEEEGPSSPSPGGGGLDMASDVEREETALLNELTHLQPLLDFTKEKYGQGLIVCTDDELMKAACLTHSLLKVSSLLETRLKTKTGSFEKTASSTRALREAIKTIKYHGVRMAKFCRMDMLMQTVIRLSKICKSSTLVAKDAVRLPSCVNDLGEYLTGASDNLREAGGNAIAAFAFSSLEQYIPLFLMQTVRVIASGGGIVAKSRVTLNGIEALDRSGSVLYRDLKGATSFGATSFWDDEVAAVSFERSASYMAMMELEMDELEAYCRNNRTEFSDSDYKLMFSMNGPRRRGDIGKYEALKNKMGG